MCGIAGEVSLRREPVCAEHVATMAKQLVHRGPDEGNLYVEPHVALAIRRLKIVGLVNGSQPVHGPHTTLVFNGEIYNYPALRRRLEAEGARFRTASDAEVIVHLYERMGDALVDDLRGMFAFALYDAARNRLLLARDRTGKKPLFYTIAGQGQVLFASSLEALATHSEMPRKVSLEAVDRFLSYRIIPSPLTIYEGVVKVEPGTIVTFQLNDATHGPLVTRQRYWSFPAERGDSAAPTEELADTLEGLLHDAIEARFQSEVPVGAFLSGGLDSSLVVAMASRQRRGRLATFSVGFEHERFNEVAHARRVAAHCGTDHHEHIITPHDALQAVDGLVRQLGEPFAFPSIIASYTMSRLAKQHVTVVLGGDGADELFCGYKRYQTYATLPHLPEDAAARARVDEALLRTAQGDLAVEYQAVLTDGLRDALKRELYSRRFAAAVPQPFPVNYLHERFQGLAPLGRLAAAMEVDRRFWLPDSQLVKADVASMAHSVEVRSPFLDERVIAFAARVPMSMKLQHGVEKVLLRRVAERYLPADIAGRVKQELAVPLEAWLASTLRGEVQRTLLAEPALSRGYFDPDRLRAFVRDFGPQQSYAVWTLYMLERWHLAFETP